MITKVLNWLFINRRLVIQIGWLAYQYLPVFGRWFERKILKQQRMANLGINVLKRDLTTLAKLIQVVDQSLEDKKINLVEGVKIALKATSLIKVVSTIKEAKAELMDLDGAEKAELAEHFALEFDLRNDEAEKVVEELVTVAINLSDNFKLLGNIKNNSKK